MKFFGFEFRKLEDSMTTVEMVETWYVSWYSLTVCPFTPEEKGFAGTRKNVQAFTDKKLAEEYAEEIRSAIKLLGHKGYTVEVKKQHTPSNI